MKIRTLIQIAAVAAVAFASTGGAKAQTASPDPEHPRVVDLLIGGSSVQHQPDWRSVDAIGTWSLPQSVAYVFLHSSDRGDTQGSYAGAGFTHDWSPRFFSYVAVGGSGGGAPYLPRHREDVDLNFKLLQSRRLVAAAGFTNASYRGGRGDRVVSAALTWYAPVILTYRFFGNTSEPGAVHSNAQFVQAAVERRGVSSFFIRHSWGNEAYLLSTRVDSPAVDVNGRSTTVYYRRWLTRRGGAIGEIERQTKGSDFERTGVRIGAFVSF